MDEVQRMNEGQEKWWVLMWVLSIWGLVQNAKICSLHEGVIVQKLRMWLRHKRQNSSEIIYPLYVLKNMYYNKDLSNVMFILLFFGSLNNQHMNVWFNLKSLSVLSMHDT